MTRVLLIFIDGIGIGTRGPHNPLHTLDSDLLSFFEGEERSLPFGGRLAITDTRLGVEGLPQSATGQTTILTGHNAAALIGRHLHGFPSPRLRTLLSEYSIYKQLISLERAVTFANAYTPIYFEKRPRFVSSTTVAAESAGLKLRTLEDLARGDAVFHDFTNRTLSERGYEAPILTPDEAGRNLARLAARHDFTMYEHFLTDKIGHDQDRERALEHLSDLDKFLRAVLSAVDLEHQTVVVTSDHGNIEDLRTRSHTLNPVATAVFGVTAEPIARQVRSLVDLVPAIVGTFDPANGHLARADA